MTIPKRIFRGLLALALTLSLLSGPVGITASAAETGSRNPTADEVIALISDTYTQIRARSGRRSFYNRCSTMVNYTTAVLGLQTQVYSCNGSGEYNLYQNIDQTDTGYDVHLYSAKEYSLTRALNAISENGTKDVYNIIIGWQSGSSYAARYYGHTCYIFAILDGNVYFYESYGLSLGGKYYREGAPIVCTIDEFARYYDRWAKFEGAVHFMDSYQELLNTDYEAPRIAGFRATDLSDEGFTINYEVSDNIELESFQIKVWTYGQTEEDAVTLEPQLENGSTAIRVNTADFGGFAGDYYVSCAAQDAAGNVKSHLLKVRLYTTDIASGTYRVLPTGVDACYAPYENANGYTTLAYSIDPASQVTIVGYTVNDLGETWYRLEDDTWINAEMVIREIQWYEVIEYMNQLLAGNPTDPV